MRKPALIFALVCLLLLCACQDDYKEPPTPKPGDGTQQTVTDIPNTPDVPVVPDTPAVPDTPDTPDTPVTPDTPPQAPDTPTVPDTPDTPPAADTPDAPAEPEGPPYVLTIPFYVPIYKGPSYDYEPVRAIGTDGYYTITEEKTDGDDLWGKLKSGLGWVDLKYIEEVNKTPPIVTSNFYEPGLLGENGHYEYLSGAPEAAFKIIFHAHRNLTELALTSMFYGDNGYEVDQVLYTLDRFTPLRPLVAELIFAGGGTIFGLQFRDSGGNMRYFALTSNGRNGTYGMQEYTK